MTTRRSFMASILAAGFAPAAIGSGILMPVKTIITDTYGLRPKPFRTWVDTGTGKWVEVYGERLPDDWLAKLTSTREPWELTSQKGFLVDSRDRTTLLVRPQPRFELDFTRLPMGVRKP